MPDATAQSFSTTAVFVYLVFKNPKKVKFSDSSADILYGIVCPIGGAA
jgi:hypothetical protein